jgi:hypothetical protein
MASTATPYGLRAVNELGGLPYAGSTRSFLIDPAGYNVNIFNGSIVRVADTGYLQIVTTVGSTSTDIFPAGTIGVFVGCSYTNTQNQTVFSQYYPANALNAVAFVIDDDRTVFQVQAAGTLAQAALGQNAILQAVQSTSTGSTTTGNSTTAISISTATTSTYGLKIVGFVQSTTSTVGDAYTDVLVKFNIGSHAYNTGTGI